MKLAFLLTFLSAIPALADSSVTESAGLPVRCNYDDGPHWRARRTVEGGNLVHATEKHLLVGSNVLDRRTRAKLYTLDLPATAMVEDAGGRLVGLLRHVTVANTTELSLRDPITKSNKWVVHPPARLFDDAAATLYDGEQIVVAAFHRHATGARLFSVDARTGATRWIGDPEQLNASHSEYFNDVTLERRGDTVVMRGWEPAGCYVQTFDLKSGRRLSSHLKRSY